MKGYIIYQTYRIINEKAHVCLFGRLENGESFLTVNYYKPYFFIKQDDLETSLKIEDFEHEETEFMNFKNERLVKMLINLPQEIPKIRHSLEENGIETFESDIRFTTRFLIDKGIKSTIEIEGDYTIEENINRVYKDPDLTPSNFNPELKVLSIDIETSSDAKELYTIALYSKDYKNVLIKSDKSYKNAVSFKDEEKLLETFKEILHEQDPDIITGWNVINFDLKVIYEKFRENEIDFVLGRDNLMCKLRIENDFFKDSKADFPGRQVIDGISLLKWNFIKLEDYKLETAAKVILKEKKLINFENKGDEIDNLYKIAAQKLIDYNIKDAELAYLIIEKSNALKLALQRSMITGIPLDRVNASIASLDSLYIPKARQRGYVCYNSKFELKEKGIIGGYVMDSVPGIYENILVLDFKSLYPSIIRTFNIDPISYLGQDVKEKNIIKAPNNACFRNDDAILPEIIKDLLTIREEARKEKNELKRYAIKILANSFFGVLANPTCRFYNYNIANAITHFGQFLIKLTAEEIEKKGYKVIYSDTDSNFVISKLKDSSKAEELGIKLQNDLNIFYNNYIKKNYNRQNNLELEYEKCFVKFLMPSIRAKTMAAKKRYAGLVIKDGKEELEFTGLESKRSDWTQLAKKFQCELLDKIFHNKEVNEFIKRFVYDTGKGKYDGLLIYKKSIRKNVADYIKTTPPHIKAARKLKILGSNKIEYIITEDGPEPIQNVRHKIDYDHYINKQLKPIADAILVFSNKTFDKIIKETKQHSLSEF
ncbi:DNA polymerase II [Candidatus Woesearchaeota archaeon]|nr:DNA polymerase II [Candidatus Woesearchaeota archaeon]